MKTADHLLIPTFSDKKNIEPKVTKIGPPKVKLTTSAKGISLKAIKSAINQIMSGTVSDADIESFLTGLNNKGISENEITGAAVVMKQKSLKIDVNCKENIESVYFFY